MAQFGGNRVYQDFEPFFEWDEDQGSVTLTIMLPGFRRDQLKVQVTSTPVLRINGEREVTQNVLRRFSKEFSIPSYCDTNNVTAKFERGTLLVKFPKIQTPLPQEQSKKEEEEEQQKEVAPPIPQQQGASSSSSSQEVNNNDQQKVKEEPTNADEKDQEKKSRVEAEPNNNEERKDKLEKEPMQSSNVETEKGKEAVTSEVVGAGGKKVIKENERKGARIAQRLKTRMLDFTLSVTGDENKDVVGQGYGGNLVKGVIKKPKILVNIVVAILLVMVLGIYVKHAFWSSSSEGGSELFQEF